MSQSQPTSTYISTKSTSVTSFISHSLREDKQMLPTQARRTSQLRPSQRSHPQPSYESLLKPLPGWHPKAWYYGLFRLGLNTIGRLSRGIQIGLDYGFDSGVMLEHVYRNKPEGITFIGRKIDQLFLDAPGWNGIRQRGELLKEIIYTTVHFAAPSGTCSVLDVACGGGRYLLEAVSELESDFVHPMLRDYREENVSKARQLAKTLDIEAEIKQADAFSDRDLSQVSPQPDVIIVSGLHEIIDDDDRLRHHFHQLYRLLKSSGYLILTVQPWHPQLELIARGLRSHTGNPWVMRLRSIELTESWLRDAGFEVLNLKMEPSGIFGVLVARKR